jgi:nucleotide-binding universal stress UspA family protein
MSRARHGAVVVGVGADSTADDAVEWAAAEAATRGCPLRVVHAFRAVLPADPYGIVPMIDVFDPVDCAAEVLRSAVVRARSVAGDLAVSTRMMRGSAARALIAEARGAAMLVVGSRGRSGLRGLVAGSVGAHVAAHAPCPVVVIRPTDGARVPPSTPGARARVVVGIDRTSACAPAVGFAFRAAAQRGIPLAAVHAWAPDPPADREGRRGRPTMAEAMARRAVEKELARWRGEYAGVPVLTTLSCGDPVQALVSVSCGAALVVVGSRGRGHLRGTVLGSVSQAVMQHVRCPIAIVRGRGSATQRPADMRYGLAS